MKFVRLYSPMPLQLLFCVSTLLCQHHNSTTCQHIYQNTVLSFADVCVECWTSIMRNRPDLTVTNFKAHLKAFSYLGGAMSKHKWIFDTILLWFISNSAIEYCLLCLYFLFCETGGIIARQHSFWRSYKRKSLMMTMTRGMQPKHDFVATWCPYPSCAMLL